MSTAETGEQYSFWKYFSRTFKPDAPEISKHNARIVLLILVGFVLILSAFVFSRQSLRLDESQSIWQSSHSLLDTYRIIAGDVHVPLYDTLLHFWLVIFGTAVSTGRLLSLIFFLLCIPALYRLGSYAYDRNVGLLATALFCISPFMNWYGNETRMYSIFVLIAILNQLYFLKLWREKTSVSWFWYAVTALFGIYTHYFFGLILVTQALFYFLNRDIFAKDDLKRFLRTAVVIFVAIAPWLLYVYHRGQIGNSTPMIPVPTTVNFFNTFSQFIFGFQNDHLNTILVSFWPISILLAFLTLRKNRGIKRETLYFITALIFPIVFTFVISFVITPVFVTRYLIFTLPALYIFLSYMILGYKHNLSVFIRIGIIALMFITLGVEIFNANAPVKENYRGAAEYLTAHAGTSDIIVLSAPFTIYPVEYYYKGAATLATLPIWDQSKFGPIPPFVEADLPKQVDQLNQGHANVWVLLSYDQGYQDKVRNYYEGHFQKLQQVTLSYGMTLYEYKLRY